MAEGPALGVGVSQYGWGQALERGATSIHGGRVDGKGTGRETDGGGGVNYQAPPPMLAIHMTWLEARALRFGFWWGAGRDVRGHGWALAAYASDACIAKWPIYPWRAGQVGGKVSVQGSEGSRGLQQCCRACFSFCVLGGVVPKHRSRGLRSGRRGRWRRAPGGPRHPQPGARRQAPPWRPRSTPGCRW